MRHFYPLFAVFLACLCLWSTAGDAAYYGILTTAIDNSAFTAGTSQGFNANCFYQSTTTSNQLTSGDSGTIGCNGNRALWANLANSAGQEIGTLGSPLYVEETAPPAPVAKALSQLGQLTQYGQLNVAATQRGGLPWNVQFAPTTTPVCTNHLPINITASTDLYTSLQHIYICAVTLIIAGQEQVSLVEGTGTTCGSGTAALMGGTTAGSSSGMPFAANGGMAGWSATPVIATQTLGDHLCLLKSSTNLLSGVITYVDKL
jgi:hypothetical protein